MFHTQVVFNLFRINRLAIDFVHFFRQPMLGLLAGIAFLSSPCFDLIAAAKESSEESIAAYADAANFQTNGAIGLAIESWNAFLKEYPDDPMASKAAHFLGVCYMQQEAPDYAAASKSFAQALQDSDYELREESLVNQGWCLYSSAGDAPNRDQDRLRESIATFETLRKEFPQSSFLDRALFYSGEAAYGLGDAKKAIANYDQLLALPTAKESPLRCDALYARGIAYEELDQYDNAVASFRQLLSSCEKSDLVTDVHLRIGDTAILKKEYKQAIESFDAAMKSTENKDDLSYALFRQAFALVQANQPGEAAKKYEQLLKDYPDSSYTASATLASAQSTYRSGDIEEAAKRFQRVLEQKNPTASTEAAHWLARIHLGKGDSAKALEVIRGQLERGAEGKFVATLKLDLGEALSMTPDTMKESLAAFEQAYRDAPDDELAPRALYNAAFSALQINEPKRAIELASEFLKKFPDDTLTLDVLFVEAESHFILGDTGTAADKFKALVKKSDAGDTSQRPLWILRAATALNAANRAQETLSLFKEQSAPLPEKAQQAEAQLLLGQAYLMTENPSDSAKAFQASHDADPSWPRASEALLMAGQALFAAGDTKAAQTAWTTIIDQDSKSRMADQARFKLAQLASTQKDVAEASRLYDEIVASGADPGLMPYAYYGRARLLMEHGKHKEAMTSLDTLLKDYATHAIRSEALLARGISERNLGELEAARKDLEAFLELKPSGLNLGHVLYELALIDQKEKHPAKAATHLERLVAEVPNYPDFDKVLYELGWSYRESEKQDAAVETFTKLIARSPTSPLSGEAAYFVGQHAYENKNWDEAAKYFLTSAEQTTDPKLAEKAFYRLGWSRFKEARFDEAEKAFQQQAEKHPDGTLAFDALMMVGECRFNEGKHEAALAGYAAARKQIQDKEETAKSLRDPADRQAREIVLLHGGQSAAQLKKWDDAIAWYDELRERFPATHYLAQVFYETGFAYQQTGNNDKALQMFGEVADNYRNEVAARARFMIGEIHFANRRLDLAIPEFQKVMYGFGAEQAPEPIKNWQAKSGFEAGRCSELLIQQAQTPAAKQKSFDFAVRFFQYVIAKHPQHELAEKAKTQLEALKK
ncbi:tol-pal system protein YbgF [Novipirellula galeiformis]|uniref:Tol-pal system protein YbgF n=1 Tax=Novipirellula galeiformis TaxID=2528004 RepID=A0A5C6CPN6_9BACT|nr:tetratricopeptide repeat protein [Novipirellula galeiformis]TWU26500.1 tol-pal system protein YbgF [Novipirellula galeiformis]